jgi:dipeptidyl aminopeptidase/acylaminoacyl peptidase
MLARTLAAAVVLALSIGLTPAGATSPPAVSENDYQRLVTLHSPAISPDGTSAVLVVSHILWDEDRLQNDLVLVDLSTHSSRRLIADRKGLSDPVFSPDGTKIAFLADAGNGDDAKTQLFVMPALQQAQGDKGGFQRFLIACAKRSPERAQRVEGSG